MKKTIAILMLIASLMCGSTAYGYPASWPCPYDGVQAYKVSQTRIQVPGHFGEFCYNVTYSHRAPKEQHTFVKQFCD